MNAQHLNLTSHPSIDKIHLSLLSVLFLQHMGYRIGNNNPDLRRGLCSFYKNNPTMRWCVFFFIRGVQRKIWQHGFFFFGNSEGNVGQSIACSVICDPGNHHHFQLFLVHCRTKVSELPNISVLSHCLPSCICYLLDLVHLSCLWSFPWPFHVSRP